MKRIFIFFTQTLLSLIGLAVLAFLLRFPSTEGRAANLDFMSIYTDPLILYTYLASTPFFIALYKSIRLLGHIAQSKAEAIQCLKTIKFCARIQAALIILATLFIKINHHHGDDPAGFLAICLITSFAALLLSAAAAQYQKKLQKNNPAI